VQRFLNDEKPESICASLGRSKAWLLKALAAVKIKFAIPEAGRGTAPSVEETGNWALSRRTPQPK
jgi:hypothetical protein